MKVFVVEMLRNGTREEHSYVSYITDNEVDALVEACEHIDFRANKYTAEINLYEVGGLFCDDYKRHISGIRDLEEQNKELAEIVRKKIEERNKPVTESEQGEGTK